MSKENTSMVLKANGTFDNYNVKADGIAVLRLEFPASEMANYIKILAFVEYQMKCRIKTTNDADENVNINLGYVYFKKLDIYREGNAKLQLEGEIASMDLNKMGNLIDNSIMLYLKAGA